MRVKTSDLIGPPLDWAAGECERVINGDALDIGFILEGGYTPSTDWAQGGPIIEREGMNIGMVREHWQADLSEFDLFVDGPTPLIAAMRCYVSSKLGDDVEIPDELINQGEQA